MIPLRDNIPTRRFPVVCVALIVLNVLVFLADQTNRMQVLYDTPYGSLRDSIGALSLRYSMIPAYVTGHTDANALTPLYVQPAWLTIFTAMFLHANWLHIGGNMLYLWIFGNNIEDVLGRGRFLLFYLACGLGAAALHIMSDPLSTTPTVGASGAVAGLMGAYLLLYPQARILSIVPIFGIVSTFMEVPASVVIGFWIVLQIINARFLNGGGMIQKGGGVAYLAHVGGFFTGMLLIALLGGRRLVPRDTYREVPRY